MTSIASSNTPTLPQVLPEYRWQPNEPSYPLKNRFEDRIQEWHNNDNNILIDTRTLWEKIVDTIICFIELIKLGFEVLIEMCKPNSAVLQHTYDVTNKETLLDLDNEPTDRPLYIFLTGFGGNSFFYTKHVKAIEEKYRNTNISPDIRVIKNHSAKDRHFEDLLSPVQEMLSKYCDHNPESKIVITGKSLSGLIVSELEYSLRITHPNNHLFVASIVGAYGSKFVSNLNKLSIGNSALPHDLGERFSHNNRFTKELVTKQNEQLPEGCQRTMVYYAGLNEITVTPPSNEFPLIDNEANIRRFVVNGDHTSTPEIIADHLIDLAFEFYNEDE
ncbi:MAG: hypothetical protein S4CHLAM20_11140 [Chlamydiia bacterium]|nr:hypothetical protein [Chlamydiia bacterium]